ncbi:MAG: DUF5686 and carboxypeptidase regulatory-like domain-containing protein [Mangrovibacterium sp.]
MRKALLSILSVIICMPLWAQTIEGNIQDSQGEAIPYANIFVPKLGTGTTSNAEGNYELKLPDGTWKIMYRYMGFQTITKTITTDGSKQTINITLRPQAVQLQEITILASGEDPAYYVMRHAIALAPFYSKQVESYNCKVYLKGSGHMNKMPGLLKKQIEKEGLKLNKTYISESISKVHFELPDKLTQETQAVRTSVISDMFSSITMPMVNLSLYDNWENLRFSDYSTSIVSPMNRNALRTYNFKLIGTFYDQDRLINQIQVTPKVKGKNKFSGTINIVDKYWNIHSVDLSFSVPFAHIKMKQIYSVIEENVWLPTSTQFQIDGNAMGFAGHADYIASVSDYQIELNNKLDHSFLARLDAERLNQIAILDSINEAKKQANIQQNITNVEIKKTKTTQKIEEFQQKETLSNRDMYKMQRLMNRQAEEANPSQTLELSSPLNIVVKDVRNDSAYWNSLRPVPLTQNEQEGFSEKDSLVTKHGEIYGNDSVQHAENKYNFADLISGKTIFYGNKHTRSRGYYTLAGLLSMKEMNFNTVDGFIYGLPFEYVSLDTLGKSINAEAHLAYGFCSHNLYGSARVNYKWNGLKRQGIIIEGGRTNTDYKGKTGISRFENTVYTLLFENNAQKFYDNRYVKATFYSDIAAGLSIKTGLQYSNRVNMANESDWKIFNWKNRSFTDNKPNLPDTESWQYHGNTSTQVSAAISYTPKQYYRVYKKQKIIDHSKYPTFGLSYIKGIKSFLGSNSDFDLLKFNYKHKIGIGLNDILTYQLTAGKYLNRTKLYAPDFSYVKSNDEYLGLSTSFNQFNTPAYYGLYSQKQYIEIHAQLNSDRILLKWLPLLNQSLLTETIRLHYYNSESVPPYFEIGYGLNNIFMLLDLSINYGISDWQNNFWSIRLGIQF